MKHTVAPRVSALLALLAAAGTAAAQFTGFATPPDNYPLNDRGRDAAIADFNLDGFLDIAVCDEDGSPATPSTVTVYLNDGDGTFTPGVPVPVGAGASGIVSGHFNADTRPDLAVACSQAGELYVLINNGAGAFIASAPYPISGSPIDVAAGQVTGGDGTTDLVTSNPGNDTVTILRGVGDGTFINASSYLARPGASGAGVGVREVKLADLNADGHDDAVVSTSDHAVVMYNTGSGGFFSGEFALYLPAGSNVRSVDVGDLNADNAPDIVAADRNANTVRVFRNNSDGTYPTFTQIASVPTPGAPISVVLADLGGASPPPLHADRAGDPAPMPALAPDGDLDIIVNGENDDAVRVALNDGTGAFTVFDDYDNTVFSPERMAVGDLDNDGDQDLAVPGLAGGLDVFLNASPGVGGPAPIARIDLPNDFTAGGCVSGIVSVQGVSYVPAPGAFDRDELWYRQLADPTFTQIGTATTPLETSGPLYNWDTSALDEGYYLVQLRTYSATGLSDTDEQVLYLSTQFDTLSVSVGSLVGGTVCINGTVNDANGAPIEYTVDYRATGSGDAFTPVNPASPTYAGPRINQGLAAWDSTTVPDGLYDIRVAASNGCGQRREFNTTIEVDNTAPEAVILDPTNCDSVIPGQTVPITGIADDLNFRTWTLQYTGGDANGWVTIDSGNTPVLAGLITEWKTTGLRPCSYTLRLLVSEDTITNCDDRRVSEFLTSVEVRCPADINADGVLDNGDISTFVSLFLAGCSP